MSARELQYKAKLKLPSPLLLYDSAVLNVCVLLGTVQLEDKFFNLLLYSLQSYLI